MGAAVIIDDGGSTRIKQLVDAALGADGILDSLMAVAPPAPNSSKATAKGAFSQLIVAFLKQDGTSMIATGGPILLGPNDNIECESENQQKVKCKITPTLACDITVQGVSGIKPIVDAKHSDGQRRYVVSNAGSIQSITVNPAGAPPPQTFTRPPGTVYAMVVLT